jgi:hypothetical protein
MILYYFYKFIFQILEIKSDIVFKKYKNFDFLNLSLTIKKRRIFHNFFFFFSGIIFLFKF